LGVPGLAGGDCDGLVVFLAGVDDGAVDGDGLGEGFVGRDDYVDLDYIVYSFRGTLDTRSTLLRRLLFNCVYRFFNVVLESATLFGIERFKIVK